jgi:hypothetical protein
VIKQEIEIEIVVADLEVDLPPEKRKARSEFE